MPDLFHTPPTQARPRLDLDGVILEKLDYPGWQPVAIPSSWTAAGWSASAAGGSIVKKIGAVMASVSLDHVGRPRGTWHGGAYRHEGAMRGPRYAREASFGIPCEHASTPQAARAIAERLAAELNAAILEAAAEAGSAMGPDNPWEVWYVATRRTDGAPPDPTKAQYSHIYYSVEDAMAIAKDEPRLVVVRAVMTGRRLEARS